MPRIMNQKLVSFGDWLRDHRFRLAISQDETALRAGITGKSRAQQYSNYERGAVKPRRSMVIALAIALEANPDEALAAAGYEGVVSGHSVNADVAAAELPRELQRARRKLEKLQASGKIHSVSAKKKSILLLSADYTHIGENLDNATESLINFLRIELSDLDIEETKPDLEYFDIAKHQELVGNSMAICTFPFFLSPGRREKWGVVPYGIHWTIGVVIHRDNPLFRALRSHDPTRDLPRSAAPIHGRPSWLHPLIEQTKDNNGNIYSSRGYIQEEILPLLTQYMDFKYRIMLAECKRDVDVKDLVNFLKPEPANIAIVDLGDHVGFSATDDVVSPTIKGDLESIVGEDGDKNKEYRLLRLHHHLLIPVGIGFTLQTLPLLLDNFRWHKLVRVVLDNLFSGKDGENNMEVGQQFAHIGIELNNELSRIIAIDGDNFNPFSIGGKLWQS